MALLSWFTRATTRAARKSPRRARLGLEALEAREVPATFTVLNTLDDGSAGSLRWAVDQANSNGGEAPTAFAAGPCSAPQPTPLLAGQRTLSDAATTTISGPAAGVTVSGNGAGRVFGIDEGASAALSKLIITGGSV